MLHARNIHKSYQMGRHQLVVLRGVSMSVAKGEFLAVTGASGSGKSTLLHILGALDLPDDGQVIMDGLDVFSQSADRREHIRCHRVGFVFQFYHLLPELTLLENVLMPRMVASSILGWTQSRRQARLDAQSIIERVGLGPRAHHRPNELSGGERQRTAIARALVNQPDLLLADEPTGNLDAKTGEGLLNLLRELHAAGQTIVMVTHDPRTAAFAQRTLNLEDGRVQAAKDG